MATPICPYFGTCGGCSAQHIDYSTQLENKKNQLANAINNIIPQDQIKVFSDKEYHYRNRMDFIFHPRGVGLREKGNWKFIVDIGSCSISDQKLNALLLEVRYFFKNVDVFDIRKNTGTFRYAVIRTPQHDSSISFVINEDSNKTADAIEKIKEFAKISTANNIIVTYVPKNTDTSISNEFFAVKGSDILKEIYLGKTFHYSVQGFFQNNSTMAEKMHEYVRTLLKTYTTTNHTLLDLYCGVGTFGIINAELFKDVVMVEADKNCIDAAEKNIVENNVKNAKAIALDAMNLKKLSLGNDIFVITDPPRSGMHPKTIDELKKLKPEVIIYISCNIDQLKKDLVKFSEYEIKSAALFDLFPQTPHAEGIVEMVRKA
jgi:23S rRNA (uracil-5-)-methyltransferase RumA